MRAKRSFRHRDRRFRPWLAVALVAALLPLAGATGPALAVLPDGFTDGLITEDIFQPTALAFTPDGRMLVTSRVGSLFVMRDTTILSRLNIENRVCSNAERGMVGVAVDPDFGQGANRSIFVYYTAKRSTKCPLFNDSDPSPAADFPVNRVSRFTLADDNTISAASEVVLIDHIPSPGIHNAGHLEFGPVDNLLYVSVGDGGCLVSDLTRCQNQNTNARRQDHLLGKILRVNRDGTFPTSNPYAQDSGVRRCGNPSGVPAGTGRCGEIFATGLRNPFRFAFKPGTNTFHINDVGTAIWEEIDLGAKGADYGWNVREGHCKTNSRTDCGAPPSGMTNPIFDYDHNTGCSSITAAAFVPEGLWPAPYSGSYLFGDYVCRKLFMLTPKSGGGFTQTLLSDAVGPIVHMAFGPFAGTKGLYYTTFSGDVRVISRGLPGDIPPTAAFTASTLSAPTAPLTVQFDARGSKDADGDPLTFHWDFGDGDTLETTSPTAAHTFTHEGAFHVTLRVKDDKHLSTPAIQVIEVGKPPTAVIQSPSTSTRFAVGDRVTVSGSGSDPNESLDSSHLSWTVIRHHNNNHTHPFFGPVTGSSISFTYPSPEDLASADNSYLEVTLTVTDSSGISRSVSRDLLPAKVSLTVQDNRSTALTLEANDLTIKGQKTFTSWVGYVIRLNAPSPQQFPDRYYAFQSWSDGKAQSHDIVTPATNTTYTANFKRFSGTAPVTPPPPPPPPPPTVQSIARTPSGLGYWLASSNGAVEHFGDAVHLGDASKLQLNRPVVGMAPTPTGKGYWLVATDGGIFAYGDARFWGSTGAMKLNLPIVGMAATPTGLGYWLVAADGGLFAFGDAGFYGSTGNLVLNRPIVGMDAMPDGGGYWLVASDGGVFAFGSAPFRGSTGHLKLAKPIVGMEATPAGDGYWFVGSDGGVFAFPTAGYAGRPDNLAAPAIGLAATPSGHGYWVAAADGAVFGFGDATVLNAG
jgi:glucose/arabinose dehydrogenase